MFFREQPDARNAYEGGEGVQNSHDLLELTMLPESPCVHKPDPCLFLWTLHHTDMVV